MNVKWASGTKTCQRKTAKFSPLPVYSLLGRRSELWSLGVQSCVSSSVRKRGHRCSAVMCANWCHMKCCCFPAWCHMGLKRTGKKERAGGVMGRPRNHSLRESPLESFQLVMQFHFGGSVRVRKTGRGESFAVLLWHILVLEAHFKCIVHIKYSPFF